MNQKEIVNNQYRYIQWGYESYKDNKTGEIREDFIDRLNEQEKELEVYKEALKLIHEELLEMHISFNMNYFIEQARERIK